MYNGYAFLSFGSLFFIIHTKEKHHSHSLCCVWVSGCVCVWVCILPILYRKWYNSISFVAVSAAASWNEIEKGENEEEKFHFLSKLFPYLILLPPSDVVVFSINIFKHGNSRTISIPQRSALNWDVCCVFKFIIIFTKYRLISCVCAPFFFVRSVRN